MRGDRHIIEAMGKTRIVVENGKVVEVGEPAVDYCPLFYKYRGIETLTPGKVRENIEFRISDFGMCTPGRKLRMRDFLSFGVSELMAMCVREGTFDCAVLVTDGAGTVVVDEPELIQGIGGRISGVVETSAHQEVVDALGRDRVLDPEGGAIDQVRGCELADDLGFRGVGVTVASGEDARGIRELLGDRATVFAVHLTGIGEEEAEEIFDTCDVVTACASGPVRKVGSRRARLTVGSRIPIYASSERGEGILRRRLERVGKSSGGEEDPPRPLV
ncbi:MAG: methanogenesis marker 8 protein [Methanomassiliicoccales archaeon]